MQNGILDQLDSPAMLHRLSLDRLEQLAREIRQLIINTTSKTGGHLAPSLGTVDLTLALYSVFNPEKDHIVWDVGHQAYAHKILTGRRDRFYSLRTKGGITGFPNRFESACDAFGVGHASTSISAALGFAIARDMQGNDEAAIAIIGDGALTGGEAYEGLNYAGSLKKDIIVILNDNEMSIDKNVGAMHEYLSRITIDPQYNQAKKDFEGFVRKIPRFGEQVFHTATVIKDSLKAAISEGGLFEEMGFKYVGPIDGHNIAAMQQIFRQVKHVQGPVLIHVRTTKGKGYLPAEMDPNKFHGVGAFDQATGQVIKKKNTPPSYTEVFGRTMIELASADPRICAITAAMPSGTGLKEFASAFPKRFFDVGIAEETAVTLAGGIAAGGGHPVVAVYSTFAQRAYDQIVHDICLQKLPITLCLDRAGLVGADGPTHHGVFDYSYLRHIPNMVVMAPKDENELRHMMYTSVKYDGPSSVRYPRGAALGVSLDFELKELPIGKGEAVYKSNSETTEAKNDPPCKAHVAFLSIGTMVSKSVEAAKLLAAKGIETDVYNMRFVKPLDTELIDAVAGDEDIDLVVTVEENVLAGGFGSAVLEYLEESGQLASTQVLRIGIPDRFIEQGSCPQLLELCGLMPEQIAEDAEACIGYSQ